MIIGIVGTLGAGKSAIVDILQEEGFLTLNLSQLLTERALERGLAPVQETLFAIGNELRLRFGPAALMEDALNRIRNAPGAYVLDGIRTLPEIALLRTRPDVLLLGVDADERVRFRRLMKIQESGEREYGITTFEEFLARQELTHPDDPFRPELRRVLAQADIIVRNDATRSALKKEVLALVKNRFPNAPISSATSARR